MQETKKCSRCNIKKSIDKFAKRSASKDKLDYYCSPCRTAMTYLSRTNKNIKCTWNNCDKNHYSKGLCNTHYTRKKNGTDMDLIKDTPNKYASLKYKYKLDKDTYDEMIKNGCYVCSSMENLTVDHDHSCCSGKTSCGKCVRGIVCQACNTTIGKLENGTISSEHHLKIKIYKYLLNFESGKQRLG
jgi:hypothetical protein